MISSLLSDKECKLHSSKELKILWVKCVFSFIKPLQKEWKPLLHSKLKKLNGGQLNEPGKRVVLFSTPVLQRVSEYPKKLQLRIYPTPRDQLLYNIRRIKILWIAMNPPIPLYPQWSLFETIEICFGSTKMEISTGKKHFMPGKTPLKGPPL